jgi:riboflavin kinase/FMN adenylyltransferase
MPPAGDYAVLAKVVRSGVVGPTADVFELRAARHEVTLPGVMNYGVRPTFESSEDLIAEVHLLDFSGCLDEGELEVTLVSRLRDEIRFADGDALASQISSDIAQARRVLFPLMREESGKFAQADTEFSCVNHSM